MLSFECSNNFLKSLITNNIKIVDQTPEIDNKGTYVYEFYDNNDRKLVKRYANINSTRKRNQFWYCFNNLEEINLFETEFRFYLTIRKVFSVLN